MSFEQDSARLLAEVCVTVRREKRANWLMDQVNGLSSQLPGRAAEWAKQLPGAIRQLPPELLGAGVGAGIGAILPAHGVDAEARRKNRLNRLLSGALLGGAAGTAYRYGTQGIPRTEAMSAPEAARALNAELAQRTTEKNTTPSPVDSVHADVKSPLRAAIPPERAYAAGAIGAIAHEGLAQQWARWPRPTSELGLAAIRDGLAAKGTQGAHLLRSLDSPVLSRVIRAALAGEQSIPVNPPPSWLARTAAVLSRQRIPQSGPVMRHGLTALDVRELLRKNLAEARKTVPPSFANSVGWRGTLGRAGAWMAAPLLYDQYVKLKDERSRQAVLRQTLQHIFGDK